jgi:hypothetical protein
MIEYELKQKIINWETIRIYMGTYSLLPFFINDGLAKKYDGVWEGLESNKEQFEKNNPEITMEFVKLTGEAVNESLTLDKEILDYIGTFEQGKKFKEDLLKQIGATDFKNHFMEWVIGDIEKASKGGAKVGAFILIACAFEYLAGFMAGKETTCNDYINFIQRFVCPIDSRYEAEPLYKSLRCGLVHNYTIKGGRYSLTDAKPHLHFAQDTKDSTKKILNLEDFISVFKNACIEYFKAVENDTTLQENLRKHINNVGFFGSLPITWKLQIKINQNSGDAIHDSEQNK